MQAPFRSGVSLIALVLFLAAHLVSAHHHNTLQQPGTPVTQPQTQPLHRLLNEDGTLARTRGLSGTFDATGWRMLTEPDGTPRFVPDAAAAAVGDESWDDRFALPGVLAGEVRAIAGSATSLYVGGSFEKKHIAGSNSLLRWDGRCWHAVGGGVRSWSQSGNWVYGQINAIAVSGSRVYVGGVFTHAGDVEANNIAVWDGTKWAALGSGIPGGAVHAIAISGSDVYAGGSFASAGGVAATGVARWNGATWSALGSGLGGDIITPQGTAYALAVSGSHLYVGGDFDTAGGNTANNIARWSGTSWSSLGGGVTSSASIGEIRALAVDSSGVYVGGRFDRAGGNPAANIARWSLTSSSWSALGSGIGGAESYELPVQALAISGGQLSVGGRFNSAGGVSARSLARWNGTNWSAWGGGADSDRPSVFAITAVGTELFVGGDFQSLGGRWVNYIGRWDGDEWRGLGQGLHTAGGAGTVRAVAVSGSGEVYVGGLFDYAGETPARNVAKWDGARWWPLGSGTDQMVSALAISGDDLYAGGWFTAAGGKPASSIAHWNAATGTWSALGNGIGDRVNTLALGGRWLYAGGGAARGYLKRWNLDTRIWSDVSDLDNPVHSIVTRGDLVFVGGNFDKLFLPGEAVTVGGIVLWDSASDTWYYIDDNGRRGVYPAFVYAIELLDNSLYVGGWFVSAGTVPANNIAQFDFSTGRWSALGSGIEGGLLHVQALAARGSDLYVGGDFDRAGGQTVNNVARWNAAARAWSPLGTGVNGDGFPEVNALGVSGGSIYVGGAFETAGALPAHNLNRWSAAAPTASALITPAAGGTLTTPDGITLQFPAGAVSTPVTVSYTPMALRVTTGNEWAIRGFALEARTADGQVVTRFQKPYTLRITYAESQLTPYGLTEDSLKLTYWNGSALVPMPTSVDALTNRLTVVAAHFTEFAVIGATQPSRVYLPMIRR